MRRIQVKPVVQPPGIKIRLGSDGRLRLLDRKTDKLLASVAWLPRGKVSVELAEGVRKEVNRAPN